MVNGKFKLGHLNVRSLLPKFTDVKNHIISNNYEIFAISETWLSRCVSDNVISVPNYHLLRKDRVGRGGGVCVYIKNTFSHRIIVCNNSIEQLWFTVTIGKTRLGVGVVYNPHRSCYKECLNALEDAFSILYPSTDELICLGDFNIDLLKINEPASTAFTALLDSLNFIQVIEAPTHISTNNFSLIDFIIVSNKNIVLNSQVFNSEGISDHEIISCILNFNINSSNVIYRTYRDLSTFNHNLFLSDLQSISWHFILHYDNLNDKITFLNNNLLEIFTLHAPLKTSKFSKPPAPWMTHNIKLLMNLRDKALTKFKSSRSLTHWNYYKMLRNYCNNAVRKEKRAYWLHSFDNCKGNYWTLLHKLSNFKGNKSTVPTELSDVNSINDFFINSVPDLSPSQEIIDFYLHNKFCNSFFSFQLPPEQTIYEILNSITSRSTGSDNISVHMLKLAAPVLLPYIVHIINSCILCGEYPSCWKHALVLPLPKVSSPTEYKHLRPISILPVMSKILEKILNIQIRRYITEFNILPDNQSGFRAQHSCTTALLNVTDDIIAASDTGKVTALILLDYSKAFDSIDHKIMISILHFIGFDDNAIKLITSFLSDRTQSVVLNNLSSDSVELDKGVPQGSILGPLLFTLYTFTFPSKLTYCRSHFYADDSQIYYSFFPNDYLNACVKINHDLNTIYTLSENHCLQINPEKSCLMLFGNKSSIDKISGSFKIVINGVQLPLKTSSRNLGLIIDNKLRFKEHINKCIQKAFINIKLIYNSRQFLTTSMKTILCEALVLSHFNFCDIVYGPAIDSADANRIQKVQNSCLRLIFGVRKRERISHKLKELSWLSMFHRRLLHSACLFYNIICSKCPVYLYRKLKFRTDVHTLNLRFKGLLTPPLHKSTLFRRSFSYNITKICNSIPSLLNSSHPKLFKRRYRAHLLAKQ